LILECTFITKEERTDTLDIALEWTTDVETKYQNVEIISPIKDVHEVIYADNHPEITFGSLESKVPIKFIQHKDRVKYGTIQCAMNSLSLDDESTSLVFE